MQYYYIGWDIGGAHLKAVVLNSHHDVIAVYQYPCPLWQGLDKLHEAVHFILAQLPPGEHRHALTMTGELTDLFFGRDDGVRQILAAMAENLGGEVTVYAGQSGLLKLADIASVHYPSIASANWLASAALAAQHVDCSLFVDIGSTTTDILAINYGKVIAAGYTDYERLISQELIYTGVVRTPVMAVAQTVLDEGREIGVMAEFFAAMADVYRLTGELKPTHDQHGTADGAAKTTAASAVRLARMIGCDYCESDLPRWRDLAINLRQQQLHRIKLACGKQLQRINTPEKAVLVGAGIGRFLAQEIARDLALIYRDFADFFPGNMEGTDYDVTDCAPAAAVASLLAKM
ncbi:MAG: H4MPT-linked C1 transfer pathway protein [Gammaproteobacteria bacterium]|nr:H4MPT-linked C1 transfer pathway protein [Gammaproteobacteria bacterium]